MALYIGGVAVDATAAEIDVLDGLDRGSIIYGNASSVTTVLDQGNADEVLTSDGTDIAWAAVAGGGDVSKVGTPANNEVGIWTGDGTIEGESNITYDGTTFGVDDAAVFNDSQGDNDFRVEGDNEEYLLFCDASTDRVGIGTDSPAQLLHLLSTTSGGKCILKMEDTNADDNPPTQQFVKNSASPAVNDYLGCTYYYGDDDAGNVHNFGGISVQSSVVTDGSEEGMMNLMTSTAGALATTMTLKGDKVGIGTTSPEETLHIEGQCFAKSSSTAVKAYRTTPTTTATVFRVYSDVTSAQTKHADIACDGDMLNTNGSYGQYSDVSLKQDISDATSQWDDVKLLASKARKFRLKAEVNALGDEAKWMLGFVAQEIEDISPYLVKDLEDEDTGETIKAVKYSIAQMKAFKALGEALDRVEQLEAKVEALENE